MRRVFGARPSFPFLPDDPNVVTYEVPSGSSRPEPLSTARPVVLNAVQAVGRAPDNHGTAQDKNGGHAGPGRAGSPQTTTESRVGLVCSEVQLLQYWAATSGKPGLSVAISYG